MKCKYKSIDIQELTKLVQESFTMAELMRKLGYTANRGNSFKGLKEYLITNNIDTTHFKGCKHGTSKTAKFSLEDILVKDTKYTNMTKLKNRVLKAGLLDYVCAECGISSWKNKPIVLQLDHINGNNRDNRLENLRLLCPNCHSQTPTFCRKNKG